MNVSTATAVYTAVASDQDAGSLPTRRSCGLADDSLFNISSSTGAVTFKASPNFEAPADAGPNNVYARIVNVSDRRLFDSNAVAITVTNVNETPLIISGATASTAVNVSTATAV